MKTGHYYLVGLGCWSSKATTGSLEIINSFNKAHNIFRQFKEVVMVNAKGNIKRQLIDHNDERLVNN